MSNLDNSVETLHTFTEKNVVKLSNNQKVFVLPEGYSTKTIGEDESPSPLRKKGTAYLKDAQSFVEYILQHKEQTTAIFSDCDKGQFTAIFDFHGSMDPKFLDFQAVLSLKSTPQWRKWIELNKTPLSQEAFAEFIEDNILDIAHPDGAELLEIATNLRAKTTVDFEKSIRLSNGQQTFVYRENLVGTTQTSKGEISVPERFIISLAPFTGSTKVQITARLRYRIKEGKLLVFFVLDNTQTLLDEVFNEISLTIAKATQLLVYSGSFVKSV